MCHSAKFHEICDFQKLHQNFISESLRTFINVSVDCVKTQKMQMHMYNMTYWLILVVSEQETITDYGSAVRTALVACRAATLPVAYGAAGIDRRTDGSIAQCLPTAGA